MAGEQYRMQIILDREKIEQENIYSYEQMMSALDKICEDSDFLKGSEGEYYLSECGDTIGSMLVLISRFKQQTWLIPNIKSWSVTDEDGIKEDVFEVVSGLRE